MSFSALAAAPVPAATLRPGVDLADELSALVDEMQRTRDWFNTQVESQLNRLRRLRATIQSSAMVEEPCPPCLSTLFEAPHPVVDMEAEQPTPTSATTAPITQASLTVMHGFSPSPSSANLSPMAAHISNAIAQAFAPPTTPFAPSAPTEAVILPPTNVATLDPELEQATLRELNDALSKAFSEISARGGMLG